MKAKHAKLFWKYVDIIYYRMSQIPVYVCVIIFIITINLAVDESKYSKGAAFVDDYGPVNMDD